MIRPPAITRVEAKAFRIPTEQPESDGTYHWDSTTLVVVHVTAGANRGLGYTYADGAAAVVIREKLAQVVMGRSPMDIPACWCALRTSLRNLGEAGIGMLAVAAVDSALWDLKAKVLGIPLVDLLGGAREEVPIYGSGGFTSLSIQELQRQLGGWVEHGISRVKMKIGTDPGADPERVSRAREAVGRETELYVDANGAYGRKEALIMAETLGRSGVTWFEEPVSHHDREGLRFLRDRVPAGMEVSVGEYGFTLGYFQDLLTAGAVDVLQADASRCGITGFLEAATLCEAWNLPLSSHCAPALHLHVCAAARPLRHLEYFHDHARIERLLFDGVREPVHGVLIPDRSRLGMGLEFREEDAHRFEL